MRGREYEDVDRAFAAMVLIVLSMFETVVYAHNEARTYNAQDVCTKCGQPQ